MATTTITRTGSHDACCCSPCEGLAPAEWPRFGTGQTLTAADLTALTDYVRHKNRLHNRYQHGWGVVCGLEVLCHDCEGSVTIRPGYAIDPCGNDIVVAETLRFDVAEAIRDCSRGKRRSGGDCDPWQPPQDPGCGDALSHWCIALRYREVETAVGLRLTTGGSACETVGRGSPGKRGGCSCGGGSGGCGCGSGGCSCGGSVRCGSCETPRTPAVTDYRPTSLSASNACAPRRVRECFDVSLIPREEPCAPRLPIRSHDDKLGPLGLIGWLIPERSLLRSIIDCVINDVQTVVLRLTEQDRQVFEELSHGTPASLAQGSLDLDAVYLALCHARAAVLEVLQDDHGATRCQLLRATAEATLAPPARNADGITENRADYIARAQELTTNLIAAWIQAILDCICRAFLPRCPDTPCDDRVELACISVRAGKILTICNHSCRTYAGAFPSTFYWMSLVPLVPLFARLLAMLCCNPDLLRRNSPLVNDLMPLLDRIDSSGDLRRAVTRNDFELPRRYVAMAAKFSKDPVLPAISERLERAVRLLKSSAGGPAENAEFGAGTADLRAELDSLRAEMAELKASVAGGRTTGRKSTPPTQKSRNR